VTGKVRERLAIAALGLFAALLVARTWMTWLNPLLDSSRELAVPARVAAGERLYRDVVAWYGPVPIWLHAAADRALGVRLTTPLVLLLPIAALLFASLYLLVRRAAGPGAAAVATAWGIALSLVARNGGALVFPYSFAAAHALAFATAGLAALLVPDRPRYVLAAVLWGTGLACKPEYPLASIAAGVLALVPGVPLRQAARHPVLRAAAAAGLLGVLPYAVAFRGLPLASLTDGPLAIFDPPPEWRGVYRHVAGTDDVALSLARIASAGAYAALLVGALWLLARVPLRFRRGADTAMAILVGAATAGFAATEFGERLDRALPPLLTIAPLSLLALAAASLAARWRGSPASPATAAETALVVFAGLGAFRVLLFFTYGWVVTPYASLAAPAVAAATAAVLLRRLPRSITLPWLLLCLAALDVSRTFRLTAPGAFERLETPAGSLRLPRAQAFQIDATLRFVRDLGTPGDGLVVFPEGGFFNLALGLPNPLRHEQLLPGHLDAAGEAAAVRRLEERPPRFVLRARIALPLYGRSLFGGDYHRAVWRWVAERYRLVFTSPATPDGTTIEAWERNRAR